MFKSLGGRTVLVIGATGSFGQHFVGLLAEHSKASELRLFSRDEERQRTLRLALEDNSEEISAGRISYLIGDVRDPQSVAYAVKGVDVIINAAAMKQVPTCEMHPIEAVKTNVLGTQNVIEAAVRSGCSTVLSVSTDKAVKPINAMGMTKAIQEKMFVAAAARWGQSPVFVTVRYGNVVGTTGSVVRVFFDQIERGRPLTVTHPDMTRFLITLDQASRLVEYALEKASSGQLLALNAKAATVEQIAAACHSVAGGVGDVPAELVGVRPGDKMHEILVSEDERRRTRPLQEFFVVEPEARAADVAGAPELPWTEYSSDLAPRFSDGELRDLIASWYESWRASTSTLRRLALAGLEVPP